MKGKGASSGIAIGKVFIKREQKLDIAKTHVEDTEREISRLKSALENAISDINNLYEKTVKMVGTEEGQIFKAHMMILDDPELVCQTEEKIKKDRKNAEWALKETTDIFIDMFKAMDNEYMKERALDIEDVRDRVLRNLLGVTLTDLSKLDEEVIIIARDLTPSDTAQLDRKKVLGIITQIGGKTSHTAIMARTLGIPGVVGVDALMETIKESDIVILDGETGQVFINPEEDLIEKYNEKKNRFQREKDKLKEFKNRKSITKDGYEVEIAANIGVPSDVESVINNGGQGIGLYRTEFLYLDRDHIPTEDEQFQAYKVVLEKMEGKPVVIRTLDIGGDKKLPYLQLPEEMNPFLGYRAIRLCLDRKDIFKVQLRALLRASIYGNLKIMFPMISNLTELREAKSLLELIRVELKDEGISVNDEIEVGIMIEIPSAAIMSDVIAREVDFFSIGTNDLIQYTFAVDRMNEKVSYLYTPYDPALLRIIKLVVDNGHREGIWVGMCGEAASDPKLIPLLLGVGLDEYSMSSGAILKSRRIMSQLSKKDMEKLVVKALALSTAEEIERLIDENIGIQE